MGRPSKYSSALVALICERLSKGEPLAAICRDERMPHPSTVRDWMAADEGVSLAIARAREDGEDMIAADCLSIADNSPVTELKSVISSIVEMLGDEAEEDVARKIEAIEALERRFNDLVQERKLRVDTRLKLLSKWNPKKYGDRIQHANDPENPMPGRSDAELDARIRELLGKGAQS